LTTFVALHHDERPEQVTALVVAGAAVLWAAVLPAAAYAAARPGDTARLFAFAVYGFSGAICHQRAERTFHLLNVPLPVCARCTGLYAGAAVAAMAFVWLSRRPGAPHPSIPSRSAARLLLVGAALPLAASLVYEWITGDVPSNVLRAGTGIVLGGAVAHLILAAVDSTR
jgi:uncharacterized membrane protein